MAKSIADLKASIAAHGLNQAAIAKHGALLDRCVRDQTKPQFKIIDTCRRDNGGILAPFSPAPGSTYGRQVVGFVPAAGAASRYSRPMAALLDALEAKDLDALRAGLAALSAEGAAAWPLPPLVQQLIAAPERAARLTQGEQTTLLADLQLPKALLPCVADGLSFLTLKHREHIRLAASCGLAGQVFVVPPGYEATFARELAAQNRPHALPTHYVPQGPALSTIRFNADATPYVDDDGAVSPVPAGHGALTKLFATAKTLVPSARAALIRNIDNVIGTSDAAITATNAILGLHATVLAAVTEIRTALRRGAMVEAAKIADDLLAQLEPSLAPAPDLNEAPAATKSLWALQARLFHTNIGGIPRDAAQLERLYARPVNVLGQVPNTGKDVGGTPCFVATPSGVEKLCLEVPHASAADRKAFLEDARRATHFNPVYAVAELVDAAAYAAGDDQFWMLAEKTYRGQPVIYYETVLYELLGNSRLANSLFVEVPRLLFNPHKTLSDAVGRRASSWLGDGVTKA